MDMIDILIPIFLNRMYYVDDLYKKYFPLIYIYICLDQKYKNIRII